MKKTSKVGWRHDDRRIASGFDRLILHEFDLLEDHRKFVEKHFSQSLENFEKNYQDEVAKVKDVDAKDLFEDYLIDEYHRLSAGLPRLQWYAQFLMVYAAFEDALNQLCRILERRTDRGLGIKDLGGQGITRSANFFRKVHGIHSPFNSKDWNDALLLGEIRNAIAHRNGEIEYVIKNKNSLASRANSFDGLELKRPFKSSETADIHIDTSFVRNAIAVLRRVLTSVANHELDASEA